MTKKKGKYPRQYLDVPSRCRHHENGIRCNKRTKSNHSFFCEDHGAVKPREQLLENIVQNNITETKYRYTLDEFKNFVTKEIDRLPTEQLNMYEELAILKSQVQFFVTKVEEARTEGDEKKIMAWTNKLNNHIADTIKQASRVWQMSQTNQQIPAIHVLAILNQIQNEARNLVDEDRMELFDRKLKSIKIGIGDYRNEEEGLTREDIKNMVLSIPKPGDVIDAG